MSEQNQKIQFNKQSFWSKVWIAFKNGIIPFVCIAVANVISWTGNQLWGPKTGFQPNLPIDANIPFVSWFIIFYFVCFPVAGIALFVLAYKNKQRAYDISFTVTIALLISGIIYFCWQTEYPIEWKLAYLPENMNFFDRWVRATWYIGLPINLLPSQHCYFAIASIITVIDSKDMHWAYRAFMIVFNIMVIFSTWFLKQHFILDFVVSFGIIAILYAFARLIKFGDKVDTWTTACKQKKIKFKK